MGRCCDSAELRRETYELIAVAIFGLASAGPFFMSTWSESMYPLSVQLPEPQIGFAVANDEAEHKALTEAGYLPAYVAPAKGKKAAPVEASE